MFSRVLSWLPWEQRQCNLRVQIDHEEYPPCIHMDLRYDDPSAKTEVDTALKITCNRPSDCMSFAVNVPGEQLNPAVDSGCVYILCITNVLSYHCWGYYRTLIPISRLARWRMDVWYLSQVTSMILTNSIVSCWKFSWLPAKADAGWPGTFCVLPARTLSRL